ncbi:DNA repair protein RecO [Mastigocladopsis repens]|uniref:DNA repair protein RecO n=1 Tax=Mastigocladopsis repens TaxID=221287 RepID=UPI00030B6570|nr:DNA repair protein RecO [Mastigocladopsis repens]
MSKTYKATGINLKTQALGESDRLVTILTREFGLVRAVAPGSRKHNSSLGGRSGMFVVNELLIAKGRSLDKMTQAQTIKSYPGLAKNLGKLAASQYLAEIVLCQALSEQPQEELYELLNEHLSRLEALPSTEASEVLAHLAHGVFHLLALAGLTPEVQVCCLTARPLIPDFTNPNWQVGFSIPTGGTVCLTAWERLRKQRGVGGENFLSSSPSSSTPPTVHPATVKQKSSNYKTVIHRQEIPVVSSRLNATELAILQHLSQPEIVQDAAKSYGWLSVEQILRSYAQYHFGRPIRSAALIDSYFAANHDATV